MSKDSQRNPGLVNSQNARPTERLVLLGASGSVGTTASRYLAGNPDIELTAVSVHSSVDRLTELLRLHPSIRRAAISDPLAYQRAVSADGLREQFARVEFFCGDDGLVEMTRVAASDGADTVLTAVVGACGIRATIAAIEQGCKVALANKETLVTAGPAISALLAKGEQKSSRASILPVDSEHNAIFQLLEGLRPDHLSRVILTASGGPFRDMDPAEIAGVSRAEVLNHPTWSMGPKITVDSAGMINKGLELIEAHFLFGIGYDQLTAFIHRDSIVHGMVETHDGGYLLAASAPDMIFPVAHTLRYPAPVSYRHASAQSAPQWPALRFEEVAPERYPGFTLCLAAGRAGGTAPALFNAANEEAVRLFLEGVLRFSQIPEMIGSVLDSIASESGTELELFLEADGRARRHVREAAGAR